MKTAPAGLRGCGPFAEATPAEVRAALIEEEAGQFDEQWRRALAGAAETFDLSGVMETLDHWRRMAWLQQDPDGYRRMLVRAAEIMAGEKLPPEPLAATKARLGL